MLMSPSNNALRTRLRDLAASRVRYGSQRLYLLLVREGWKVNHKRIHRLYKETRTPITNPVSLMTKFASLQEARRLQTMLLFLRKIRRRKPLFSKGHRSSGIITNREARRDNAAA